MNKSTREIFTWYTTNVPYYLRSYHEDVIINSFKQFFREDDFEDAWLNDPHYDAISSIAQASSESFWSLFIQHLDDDYFANLIAYFLFNNPLITRGLLDRSFIAEQTPLISSYDSKALMLLYRTFTDDRDANQISRLCCLPYWLGPLRQFGIFERLVLTNTLNDSPDSYLWDEEPLPEPAYPWHGLRSFVKNNIQAWAPSVSSEFLEADDASYSTAMWRHNEMLRIYSVDMAQSSRFVHDGVHHGYLLDTHAGHHGSTVINNRAKYAGLKLAQHLMVTAFYNYRHNENLRLVHPEMIHPEAIGLNTKWAPIAFRFYQHSGGVPDPADPIVTGYVLNMGDTFQPLNTTSWYPAPLLGYGCLDSRVWAQPGISENTPDPGTANVPVRIDHTMAGGLVPRYLNQWLNNLQRPRTRWLDSASAFRIYVTNPEMSPAVIKNKKYSVKWMNSISTIILQAKDRGLYGNPAARFGYLRDSYNATDKVRGIIWNPTDDATRLLAGSNVTEVPTYFRATAPMGVEAIESMFTAMYSNLEGPVVLHQSDPRFIY